MSNTGFARQLVDLFAGRWQIPVAFAAVATVGATLYQIVPSRPALDVAALLGDVAILEKAGAATDAAEALNRLLTVEPPLPPREQARVHDDLASLLYRQELKRRTHSRDDVQRIAEHDETAERLGFPVDAARALREAQVAEWLGNGLRAIPAYRAVLAHDPLPEQRRQALQGLVKQLEPREGGQAERKRLLEELMADEGVSVGYLWWGLQQSLQDALDASDTAAARQLLERYGPRLKSSDLRGYWEYLEAWITLSENRPEDAAPLVGWVDDWLGTQSLAELGLADYGHLPAMNRWLLGQIHLAQRDFEAALQAFDEAMGMQPFGDLFLAAAGGRIRALAELERADDAEQTLRDAVAKLPAVPAGPRPHVERLRRSLFGLFGTLVQGGAYDSAAEYLIQSPAELTSERLTLAANLTRAERRAAAAPDGAEKANGSAEAGRCLEQAAELTRTDEARCAALLRLAAQAYEQAGRTGDVRRVLVRFLRDRSSDARIPRALLELGQACEADGDLKEALRWYGRLERNYPRLEEAYRARLRAGCCLAALDQDKEAEAELRGLLDDDNVAPQAGVFHDALWALCGLLYEQGRYGGAIGRLENFHTLYPDDPERYHGRFLLADAYQRSAAGLRGAGAADKHFGHASAASRQRLTQAADLFAELVRDLGNEPNPDERLKQYERLALFARADCLFELNEPATLRAALELYQQAAARFDRDPAALTAQVQIANIHLRLGHVDDAARAIERARWLLPGIPDGALADAGDGGDRNHWDRYLAVLSSSELFRRALAAGP